MNKSNVFFALVISAATLGFSSQAFAVTRTCPVKGVETDGGGHFFVQGVPGTGRTVLAARQNSRSLTLEALKSTYGMQAYFSPFIPRGTVKVITAYTYNNNGSGCDTRERYTKIIYGSK